MASTPNSQAIGLVNNMFDNTKKLWDVYQAIKADIKQWSDIPFTLAKTLEGFATIAVLPDGQLGAPDSTPSTDATHVMNTDIYTTLNRGLSQADVVSLNTFFGEVAHLMEGAAVTQQQQAPALIAKIVGS